MTLLEFVFGGEDEEDLYSHSKTLVTVWAKYVILHQNDVIEFFQKLVWLIDFGVTVREISRLTL